jgi:hypothetical protein
MRHNRVSRRVKVSILRVLYKKKCLAYYESYLDIFKIA